MARFISVDPRWRDFPGMSPFAYAANNPIKLIDENGEGPIDPTTGKRKTTTYITVAYWVSLAVGGKSVHPESAHPFVYDDQLYRMASSNYDHWNENEFESLRPKTLDYTKRPLKNTAYGVYKSLYGYKGGDITDDIENAEMKLTLKGNFNALKYAAETGNYIYYSNNWFDTGFEVTTVEDGIISNISEYAYDSKSDSYYKNKTTFFSNIVYTKELEGGGKEYYMYTIETTITFDSDENMTSNNSKIYTNKIDE